MDSISACALPDNLVLNSSIPRSKPRPPPCDRLVDRLWRRVCTQPSAIAIAESRSPNFSQQYLRYDELWSQAWSLAETLRSHGVVGGDIVGVQLAKSLELVISMIAVWLIDAAFVPLDPDMPSGREALIVRETSMCLLIRAPTTQQSATPNKGPASVITKVVEYAMTSAKRTTTGARPRPPSINTDLGLTAYVIYTSGSTGRPKGVQVTHRGLVNLLEQQIKAFALEATSQVLWFLSPSFDASISDVGTSLLSGATLHIVKSTEPNRISSSADLTRALRECAITHVDLPPSLLALLDIDSIPKSLQTIVIGGEACPAEVVAQWANRVRLVNVYGPTEATVCSSLMRCNTRPWSTPLIGRPLEHVIYTIVRDANGETNNDNDGEESGELYIGGIGVANGYIAQPELTSEKFVIRNGQRFFRTGDRVRRRPNGDIEFLGRLDRQFKIHGKLVAPEEIEADLSTHPLIKHCVVIDRVRGPRTVVVAFYIATETIDSRQLKEYLASSLPNHLVPTHLIALDRLPTTASGKPDIQALRDYSIDSHPTTYPPTTPTEKALATAWSRVLKLNHIGTDDDFFMLGGDSLAVIEATVAAATEGVHMAAEHIYTQPVLGLLARDIDLHHRPSPSIRCAELRADPIFTQPWSQTTWSRKKHDHQTIFITGATGFLGRFVVRELLKRKRDVICLVRADDETHARARLAAVIGHRDASRLSIVVGDLTEPHLGLSNKNWNQLGDDVTSIFHCAATVNLALPYSQLRAVNVEGTAQILNLMSFGSEKELHYASTLSVFVGSDQPKGLMLEDSTLEHISEIFGGYAQSKWVAEQLVREADQGLGTISIYRFGLLTGDSVSGKTPATDWLRLFVRGLTKVGLVPTLKTKNPRVDITPVDYASAAMVEISTARARDPRTTKPHVFHIANPKSTTMDELVAAIGRRHVELAVIPPDQWLAELAKHPPDMANAVALLGSCGLLDSHPQYPHTRAFNVFQAGDANFDMRHANAILGPANIHCPSATPKLLDLYISQMLSSPQ